MTPEEFAAEVRKIIAKHDREAKKGFPKWMDYEACHSDTDDLMEQALISLGYGEGIALIRKTTRWYA